MRVITWNVRKANDDSRAWDRLLRLNPDIALVQDFNHFPEELNGIFHVAYERNALKKGNKHSSYNAVLVNKRSGSIVKRLQLSSTDKDLNNALNFYKGNFFGCVVQLNNQTKINVLSVYAPYWNIDYKGEDTGATDVLMLALKESLSKEEAWVIGGDLNMSQTFGEEYKKRHGLRGGIVISGTKDLFDGMRNIGLKECLYDYNSRVVPSFRNAQDHRIIHQIDHLFVTEKMFLRLKRCDVDDASKIFTRNYLVSDHLPVIADFQ